MDYKVGLVPNTTVMKTYPKTPYLCYENIVFPFDETYFVDFSSMFNHFSPDKGGSQTIEIQNCIIF